MKTHASLSILFASLLLIGTALPAAAQTTPQDHEAHHPAETQAAPAPQPATPGEAPAAGMPGGMPGMMGMMTPDMMRMMQGMMAQEGGEAGQPGMMMGPGMMGPGMMPGMGMMGSGMMGQGMMGQGMMPCPMMPMMMRMRGGGMHAMGGPGVLYGMQHGAQAEMTPERVRAFLEQRLAWHGNPRLKIGEIVTAGDGNIIAEIVTVDGSLVQKLAFNRYPGLFRQVP